MSKLINAVNFAFETVMTDEEFLDSELTPDEAEEIVHTIITTQFPKCYSNLKKEMIQSLKLNRGID